MWLIYISIGQCCSKFCAQKHCVELSTSWVKQVGQVRRVVMVVMVVMVMVVC